MADVIEPALFNNSLPRVARLPYSLREKNEEGLIIRVIFDLFVSVKSCMILAWHGKYIL